MFDYTDAFAAPKILRRYALHPKSQITRTADLVTRADIKTARNPMDKIDYHIELNGEILDYNYTRGYNKNASVKFYTNEFVLCDASGTQLFKSAAFVRIPGWIRVVLNMRAK